MGVVQRLNQFIEIKGISKYKFYQKTGLSNGALDKGDNLGSDKCEKIYYAFPEINLVWLLTGQGEMITSAPISVSAPQEADNSFLYNMYKEKEEKVEAQAEQIGALKQMIRQLEEKIEGLQQSIHPDTSVSAGSTRIRKSGVAESGSARFAEQP